MLYVVQPKLNWKSSTARGGKLQIEKRRGVNLKKSWGRRRKQWCLIQPTVPNWIWL